MEHTQKKCKGSTQNQAKFSINNDGLDIVTLFFVVVYLGTL